MIIPPDAHMKMVSLCHTLLRYAVKPVLNFQQMKEWGKCEDNQIFNCEI